MSRYDEPGTWGYDKGLELQAELADETETFVEMLQRLRKENPEFANAIATEQERYEMTHGECLVCRFDGWQKCKAMTYEQHEYRLQIFEDNAS